MKGQQTFSTNNSPVNAQDFFTRQLLNQINTAEPVQVVSVSNAGGLAPAGTVTVQPLVNLVDGEGNGHGQSQLFALPYLRIQGGENAVVCDPKPGDMGLAVYAMRDTEAVKDGRGASAANPGSARAYSKSDGFYLGGFLNKLPKRYVMVDDEGLTLDDGAGGVITLKSGKLTIVAPAGVEGTAPTWAMGGNGATATINANVQVNGSVQSSGDQTAGGVSQMHHTHTGVQPGGGSTGEPNQ